MIKMNKKAMLPRDILISIIIFGMFITGAFLILGTMYNSYGTPYTDTSSTYNKVGEITAQTTQMQENIKSSGASPIGFLEYISSGAWSSLVLLFNSGSIISSMATAIGNDYNIPPIYIMSFMGIVMISIVFGVISAIFRKKS
jgi:hypothetical protein